MRKYKFNYANENHFVNAVKKNLKSYYDEYYDIEFNLSVHSCDILKEIYKFEIDYGEVFNELGYRRPNNVAWAILKYYNRDNFTQDEAMDWALEVVLNTVNEYKINTKAGVIPSDVSVKRRTSQFNSYTNTYMIDEIGVLEGSRIVYRGEESKEIDKNFEKNIT